MPFPAANPRALLALLLTLPVTLPLTACGGEDPVPAGDRPVLAQPDNPSVASAVAEPNAPRIINVVVTEGRLTGDTGVVQVKQNVPVRLSIITDKADTLVVRGYDVSALATAEVPVQLDFIANRVGEFAIVLEDAGLELTRLRVG